MASRLATQATHLHKALSALVKRYQFRDRNAICAFGISVTQCYTLEALGEHGPLAMQALADKLHLAISTLTRVVDQLVAKNLVERLRAARDRRVCEVQLTEAGRTLLQTIHAELLAREQALLRQIPADSRDHVIWAITHLSSAIDDWWQALHHIHKGVKP